MQKAVCEVLEQLQELGCPLSTAGRDTSLIPQLEATGKAAIKIKKKKSSQKAEQTPCFLTRKDTLKLQ